MHCLRRGPRCSFNRIEWNWQGFEKLTNSEMKRSLHRKLWWHELWQICSCCKNVWANETMKNYTRTVVDIIKKVICILNQDKVYVLKISSLFVSYYITSHFHRHGQCCSESDSGSARGFENTFALAAISLLWSYFVLSNCFTTRPNPVHHVATRSSLFTSC